MIKLKSLSGKKTCDKNFKMLAKKGYGWRLGEFEWPT